jgi:hypothetical protein
MDRELPPIAEILKSYRIDVSEGRIFRILKDGNEREIVGSLSEKGYLKVSIFGKKIRKHRLIFATYIGHWGFGDIDHINGDKTDNKISNLREVSRKDNSRNLPKHVKNTSGHMGVVYQKANRKWVAKIGSHARGTFEYLGIYEHLDDAIAARKAAEIRHGYHENHGREG